MIEQIRVSEGKCVEVVFRYGDECRRIIESLSDEMKMQAAV
jgi:hypothetical protein